MLKLVDNDSSSVSVTISMLDGIVTDGARRMLAAALGREVEAYVDAHATVVDGVGHRMVFRNGHAVSVK